MTFLMYVYIIIIVVTMNIRYEKPINTICLDISWNLFCTWAENINFQMQTD
jgi:hypothetical protein